MAMGHEKIAYRAHVLPGYADEIYHPIPITVAQFLDNYSKGDKNLSDVQCPSCLGDDGFLAPPDTYRESARNTAVESYLRLEHWKNRKIFQFVTSEIRKTVGSFGVSVSLIYKNTVYVKYETKLEFKELPRVVSLDAHAILSKHGFVLLNATSDWRTRANPLVEGPPNLRFYAGVKLVTPGGQPIGVLAVFNTLPKVVFSPAKVKQLSRIASQLMALLDTPSESVAVCDEKFLPENPNAGDFELAELSSRLGRATCSGGHMTIFERDGSGSCYSHSHIFKLSHHIENKQISESVIPESQRAEICQLLSKVRSLKGAGKIITKYVASEYNFDCVVVIEIRFMEQHKVPRSALPDNPSQSISQRLQKSLIADSKIRSERCKTRVLASNLPDNDMSNTDHRIWQEAFLNERGCEIFGSSGVSIYNSGFILPFYTAKPNLVRKNKKSVDDDPVELYLRSGGYLIGAFNKTSNRSSITPSLTSKIFDISKIARGMFLNK